MIETLDDWNTRLGYCGCCQMPDCPLPVVVEQMKTGFGSRGFVIFPYTKPAGGPKDLIPTLYLDQNITFSGNVFNGEAHTLQRVELGGGFSEEIFTTILYNNGGLPGGSTVQTRTVYIHDESDDTCESTTNTGGPTVSWAYTTPIACPDTILTPTSRTTFSDCAKAALGALPLTPQECPGPFTNLPYQVAVDVTRIRHYKLELEDPVEPAEVLEECTEDLDSAAWGDELVNFGGSFIPAFFSFNWPVIEDGNWTGDLQGQNSIVAEKQKTRFRFRIPNTHLGSKFTITYDVAEFPQDEDVDPFSVSEDNVVEWTGPGDQEDPEGDSWLAGDWTELDPPEDPGERRIVNVRYTCYSGTKYGVKPQVMGEAFEPPAP